MSADELIKKYTMEEHQEKGLFIERHYEDKSGSRPASGSIYYYVSPGMHSEFHRIDCDEYWCHNAGSNLDVWVIDKDGHLQIKKCGVEDNAEPFIRFAKGEIFATRLSVDAADGAFITCITVPRFTYDGFEIIEKEKMIAKYPETKDFWE